MKILPVARLWPKADIADRWESGFALTDIISKRAQPFRRIQPERSDPPQKDLVDKTKRHCAQLVAASDRSQRSYIVDSGASLHFVKRKELTPKERSQIRTRKHPVSLQTANGVVEATEEINLFIAILGITITALVLDDTVSVLSLGKLCR